jgi:hypothetical protein
MRMMPQTRPTPSEFIVNKRTLLIIAPILPGKTEVWRRFIQEIGEARRWEHESSRRHLGIQVERVWISETLRQAIGIILIETDYPEQALTIMAGSDNAFDRWYREQLLTLQGFDLTHPNPHCLPDLIFAWQGDVG